MKKTVFVVLVIAMSLAIWGNGKSGDSENSGALTGGSDNFNVTGYPIVKEKITLTAFGNQNVTHKNWDELWAFEEYEKLSNIHMEWITAPNQGYQEKKNVLLASGDYPDIFYRAKLQVSDLISYGSKGVFIPMNDLLTEYAYNFNERVAEYPEILRSITLPDGNIYALPTVNSAMASRSQNSWINTQWLNNLGLDMPTTKDDLYNTFIAFKENDANGNGNDSDEIPYSCRNQGTSIFTATYSSFNMGNLGSVAFNEYIDLDENGKVRLFAVTDNFKEQLNWIAGMYGEGLLDQEMFTQDIPTFTAKGEQNIIGAFFSNNSPEIIGGKNADDFKNIGPLANDKDVRSFNNIDPMVAHGAFAISLKNEFPKESIRWVDYYYGAEGDKQIRLGKEGLTFTYSADKGYALTDLIINNPDGLNVPQAIGQYAIAFAGGGCPEFIFEEYERGRLVKSTFEGWEVNESFLNVKDLVLFTFTTDEQEKLNALTADIKTYIDESKVAYITGSMSLNDWDKYVNTLKKMGMDEYVAIYQAAYDRWSQN